MKHILSFSGGKDSTAMLLMAKEKNYPIDEIIFCDTGKEFPALYRHIDKIEKYINIPITRIKAEKSFDYWMFEHIKPRSKRIEETGYGWPSSTVRWCTGNLKIQPIKKYLKNKYGDQFYQYIGMAYDEIKRGINYKVPNVIYPLIEWKITEAMALKYCYDKGFDWEGLYTHFDRVSCWCCPLKNQRELYMLYSFYPELWEELKDMDRRMGYRFKKDCSVQDYENMFKQWQENINKNKI